MLAIVILRFSGTPRCVAGGKMLAWGGIGTGLHPDFVALRLEINCLRLMAVEKPPPGVSAAAHRQCTDPVHVLCRALRLAPATYRRFELAAAQPHAKLQIEAFVSHHYDGCRDFRNRGRTARFDSVTQLAAAMQRFAAAEGLAVQLSADQLDVVVRRADAPPADAVEVRHAEIVKSVLD